MTRALSKRLFSAWPRLRRVALGQFAAGSSVNSGPAVVDGSVFWGSGYSGAAEGNGNNRFYAFSLGHGK